MKRRQFFSATAGMAAGAALPLGGARAVEAPVQPDLGGLKHPKIKVGLRNIEGFFGGSVRERLEQTAAWGAAAFEKMPKDGAVPEVRAEMQRLGLAMAATGGCGSIAPGGMVNPEDHAKLAEDLKKNIAEGKPLDCKRYLVLSGNKRDDISVKQQTGHVIECLKKLGDIAASEDVILILEALNTLVNHPGYLVSTTAHSMEIMEAVDNPHVTMLFDIYHQQITEGNVIRNITENVKHIGHFHFADNPGRHEPGTGEMNYANIFKAISETPYDGFVVAEFSPIDKSPEGRIRALNAIAACLKWT